MTMHTPALTMMLAASAAPAALAQTKTLDKVRTSGAIAMDAIPVYGLKAGAASPPEHAVVGDAIEVEPCAIVLRRDDPA